MKKLLIILIVLISGMLAAGVRQVADGVEFSYTAPNAGMVSVAGDFNSWNTDANPLQKASDGEWKTIIALPEGSHSYKFVVDGAWLHDDQNPNLVEDGYGGSNSLVEVSASGEMKKSTHAVKKMPSTLNPKVYFDGRYYVLNNLQKDEMSHYSLDKPYHDLNLGIRVKLNSNMEGYTTLNINNTREGVDMWKTHLNYKRTVLRLYADYLYMTAFDNTGEICFDDPLHIVGAQGYYNYKFGYDYRGIYLHTNSDLIPGSSNLPFTYDIHAFSADEVGDYERDVAAVRMRGDYNFDLNAIKHKFSLGGSYYLSRVNNQFSRTFNDTLTYSGNIVESNPAWEIDGRLETTLSNPGWQGAMKFNLNYEHYAFDNKNEYQDYNEEDYEFLITEEDQTWQDGSRDYLSFDVMFPKALKIHTAIKSNTVNLYYEDLSEGIIAIPSPDINEAELNKTQFEIGFNYEIDNLQAGFQLTHFTNDYPDSVASWTDYYNFMERTDGNGKWYQEYNELSYAQYMLLGYDKGLLCNFDLSYRWNKLLAELDVNAARYDLSSMPDIIENSLRLCYDISPQWQVITDTRIPVYNSVFLGIDTDFADDEDVFIANYTALKYHLNDNVWIALSYGVNPTVINDTTDEFYEGGRREYLEEAGGLDDHLQNTYNGFGEKVRMAEEELMKDDRISLEAVIQF